MVIQDFRIFKKMLSIAIQLLAVSVLFVVFLLLTPKVVLQSCVIVTRSTLFS